MIRCASAFLLGGGADMSLATAADEAARDASKPAAKEVFLQKQSNESQAESASPGVYMPWPTWSNYNSSFSICATGDGLPRSWFVASYFSSYSRMSSAFSLKRILREEGGGKHLDLNLEDVLDEEDGDDEGASEGDTSRKLDRPDLEMNFSALQLLSTLVQNIEEVSSLVWSRSGLEAKSAVLPVSSVSRDTLEEDFIAGLTIVDQGRLAVRNLFDEGNEPLQEEDEEGDEDQEGSSEVILESPSCPFLLKLISLLLGSALTRGKIVPFCPPYLVAKVNPTLSPSELEADAEAELVSERVLARLSNICGSVLYLLGQSTAAEDLFRLSISQDGLLEDSRIKLAALLVDMEQLEEVRLFLFC